MRYWLLKSEPYKYAWEQLLKDKRTFWDGVRNYQARNNLKAMQEGDVAFFYHSNEGLEIVGIVEIIREHYPDPSADDARWVAIDIKPLLTLRKKVRLAEMKQEKVLHNLSLIRQGRLSVCPVAEAEFYHILQMANTELKL